MALVEQAPLRAEQEERNKVAREQAKAEFEEELNGLMIGSFITSTIKKGRHSKHPPGQFRCR